MLTLEDLGIPVESSHHEVALSQHEIDLRHTDALTMADTVMTYRVVVKEIAMRNGYYASFIPTPVAAINGSGMHVHQSLFSGNINAFYDQNDPDRLTDVARNFAAGLLKRAREITSITNQWVNSYKRLGTESRSGTARLRSTGIRLLGQSEPIRPATSTCLQDWSREIKTHRIPCTGPFM